MPDLIAIAKSWFKYAQGSDATKRLMEARLAICGECPYRKQLSKTGKVIVTVIHEDGSTYKCGLCNCPLAGLTALQHARCKAAKW